MRYIKTYEKFNVVNENWFLQAFNWIKEKLSGWISKLTGEVKEGAEYGMNWVKENPELMEETTQKLKQQNQSELMKLWNWVKSFVGNPLQIQPIVNESVEDEETETMLQKIARISGASITLLACFGAPVAAFLGLAVSSGLLFIIGAIVSIIAWSLVSLFKEDTDTYSNNW
jgi:hypothetical protein